jgi:hypothetical protein
MRELEFGVVEFSWVVCTSRDAAPLSKRRISRELGGDFAVSRLFFELYELITSLLKA